MDMLKDEFHDLFSAFNKGNFYLFYAFRLAFYTPTKCHYVESIVKFSQYRYNIEIAVLILNIYIFCFFRLLLHYISEGNTTLFFTP